MREAGIAEQVAGCSPEREEPDCQREERRDVPPGLLARGTIDPERRTEQEREKRAGLLGQNECHRGQRRGLVPAFQK
jgi:hypothetical protein